MQRRSKDTKMLRCPGANMTRGGVTLRTLLKFSHSKRGGPTDKKEVSAQHPETTLSCDLRRITVTCWNSFRIAELQCKGTGVSGRAVFSGTE